MPYNFVPESFHTAVMAEALRVKIYRKSAISHQRGHFDPTCFHTKKLCSRLSSSEVHFLMEIGRFAFLRPLLEDLGATYDDYLRLIGKCLVDFLLALIELFSLRVTAEELRAIIG